jgi:hypothetical protein
MPEPPTARPDHTPRHGHRPDHNPTMIGLKTAVDRACANLVNGEWR